MVEILIASLLIFFIADIAFATTTEKETFKCSICGKKSEFFVMMSTSSFGSPDLDLRPPELQRSTMCYWIQECPECGYVAADISEKAKPEITREWLESDEYTSCYGIKFESDLATRFFKHCINSLRVEDFEEAFYAVLHAAWACDDEFDFDNAKKCREIAIRLTSKIELDENLSVMKADLLRRSGNFDRLIKEYSSVKYSNEDLNQIIEFELKKAHEKDDNCYTVDEAFEDDE